MIPSAWQAADGLHVLITVAEQPLPQLVHSVNTP